MPTELTARATVDVGAAYAAHRSTLLRLAVLLVDDPHSAEDVVQEAFLGLQRQRDKVLEPAAVFGYLRTSVVHRAHDVLRRRRTVRRHLRAVAPDSDEPADAELLLTEVLNGIPGLNDHLQRPKGSLSSPPPPRESRTAQTVASSTVIASQWGAFPPAKSASAAPAAATIPKVDVSSIRRA